MSGNFIREYKNQFPDSFCDQLIGLLEDNDKTGNAHQGASGKNNLNIGVKNSVDLDLLPDHTPGADQQLFLKFDSFLYEPVTNYVNSFIVNRLGQKDYLTEENVRKSFVLLQPPKLKRYRAPHQGFHAWHQDWGIQPVQAKRMLVVMVYLNDVEEGGETAFFHQNLKIKPEKGKMVIFPPYFTHMHKGMRPVSNDKYICNLYIGVNPNL